jgi:hypothetical protein
MFHRLWVFFFACSLSPATALGQCTAVYPESEAILAPGASAWDLFGIDLAVSGDRLVVGAPYASGLALSTGSVSTFVHDGIAWQPEAQLYGSDSVSGDHFGQSVAMDGELLVVGAWRAHATAEDSGAAYVFRLGAEGWVQEAKLVGSDTQAEDLFGSDVAVQGETIVIGAWWHDTAGVERSGKVYVFRRVDSAWTEVEVLTAESPANFARFGFSVSIDADRLVVGAPGDGVVVQSGGTVHIFREQGAGDWVEEQQLLASPSDFLAERGYSVAIEGETIAVGSADANEPSTVRVYDFDGVEWSETAALQACDAWPRDDFGCSVALRGDQLLVGAQKRLVAPDMTGAAYLFHRDADEWLLDAQLIASDLQLENNLGISVGFHGERLLVGADWSGLAGFRSGTVYEYEMPSSLGEHLCPPMPNSSGHAATLTASGSCSVAANDLVLRAFVSPRETPGLLIYGSNTVQLPFGDGYLCVSPFHPGIIRLNPLVQADQAGVLSRAIDFTGLPAAGAIEPGSTWNFQFWFRDPMGPGGTGFNLSNALQLEFEP